MPTTIPVARRTASFSESVIREMTRVAREEGAMNLAQGFPDFEPPALLKDAACEAIRRGVNQYAITWGSPSLRHALASTYETNYGLTLDPDREITVTCGATEAMACVSLSLFDPGDEVIVLSPFYENYGPDAILAGAVARFVDLTPPDYLLDLDRIASVVNERTRAIVINTPNNPTGRVFTDDELQGVARLCQQHDLVAITDEIYEHIVYEGRHRCLATFDGMRDRTIVVSGASKTFSVTGWRVGTIVAPPEFSDAIRKVHDFLTVGAPAPLQEAVAAGLTDLGSEYFEGLADGYKNRREILLPALREAGFTFPTPQGAYYVLADFSALSGEDDHAFARTLAREAGVTPVPGSSFFDQRELGRHLVRFVFCKKHETLEEAADKLFRFASRGG